MAKVTETFRGSEKIGYEGHLYTYQRSLEDGTRTYRCSKKSSLKCNARLYYNPTTEEYSVAGLHVEDPDPGAVEAEAMKSNIRKRARETHEASLAHTAKIATLLCTEPEHNRERRRSVGSTAVLKFRF